MARRTLTFIHNSFHCLSSCWYSSRKHVWFGFLTTNVPLTLKKWSGTIWPHVYCHNVQHRGLFALSFLLSPLGSTCCNDILLQFKGVKCKMKIFLRSVLQIQGRACWECWMVYVTCFGERLCAICGPHAQICIIFSNPANTENIWFTFKMKTYDLYLYDFSCSIHEILVCAHWSAKRVLYYRILKIALNFKKLWTKQPHALKLQKCCMWYRCVQVRGVLYWT